MFIKNKNISEDDLLWSKFLSGSEDAYGLIYKKYSKKLFIQGLQFTSDKELIKDCIHDVFVKIYKNRKNLKPLNNLKIYLFISLRNSILTTFKKNITKHDTFEELSEDEYISEDNIEEELISRENENDKIKFIARVLSQLSQRQREVIHYRFYENMSIDEICILMDMNYQSVQNLIQRSLKKINDFLKKK